jgi:hypothetical protein
VADLVVKYIPIVFFHSHETYFPSSIEYFLANCQDTNASLQFGITSSRQQRSFIVNNPHCQYGFHESKDLDATPLYVSCIEIHPCAFRISYYLFFPHQAECWYCNGVDDLSPESGQQQLSPVTELFEIQVTTEGHITNVWINSIPIPVDELEFFANRIVLYSLKGIHTLVNRPPTQFCGDYYITQFVARTIEIVNKKSQ